MNKWSIKHKIDCEKSINKFKNQLFETVKKETVLKDMDIEEKIKLFKEFIQTDDNFKTKYRETVVAIDLYFEQLKEVYKKIKEEKENIKERYTRLEDGNIGEEIFRNNSLFIPESGNNTDFFSLSQILRYKENKDYLTLDLPIRTRKGFVIFKDFVDANTVKSSQLGSRIFSVSAETAPAPNDILWTNITKGVVSNQCYKIFGDIMFVIFNLGFIFLVIKVLRVLDTKNFREDGYFMRFLNSYDVIRSSYEGFIPPVIYALILFVVPTFITILINLEGVHSHSKFQRILMEKFLYFLFYNGFISVFLASTLISQIYESSVTETNFLKFLTDVGKKLLESSVFFFNTIVQKGLFGTAMFLLKPGPLIVNYLLVNILPNKTRREVVQAQFCPSFNFGSLFPSVLIVFPMVLVYAILVPPILIPGFFYFLFNFYAFKNEFLYATRTEYESGGVFWQTSVKIIINSVLFFQIVTVAKFIADGRYFLFISVTPLLWISWNFESTINKLFRKCCNLHPLNIKEEQYLDEFTYKLNKERIELLNAWEEEENDPINNIDRINVTDLGYIDEDEVSKKSYYRDPNTSSSISDFILPKGFFNLLKFLKKNDSQNLFGYKDGSSKKYKN
ncbi:putative membrane protein [Nosema bombycis CQ1]|uniref:Putative membrane protein n=1 Tax=Nosema bombycis (strain CQ1 / CVCC 102059) TaxID=578461 RepID=R0KW82_NOSB1|nr:putative membrane protein [Nosema bombycis CQ1]|eukprot:EOB14457.1 putative membrane protein [Nosema bombycis CQ1]